MENKEKMDPELKAKWLEALRSGKYEQGIRVLKTKEGKFCCLGVLCDISGKGSFIEDLGDYDIIGGPILHANCTGDVVLENIAGLQINPKDETKGFTLTRMNDGCMPDTDSKRFSFAEIAEYIEKVL